MPVISVSLALRAPTLAGTARVRDAVEAAGGVITQARELSSWAIALTVEIDSARLGRLHELLARCDAVWLDDSELRLRELGARLAEGGSCDVIVLMHVELINDEPERPVKVPAVPG